MVQRSLSMVIYSLQIESEIIALEGVLAWLEKNGLALRLEPAQLEVRIWDQGSAFALHSHLQAELQTGAEQTALYREGHRYLLLMARLTDDLLASHWLIARATVTA